MNAVKALSEKGHSLLSACEALSFSRATYYRGIAPTPTKPPGERSAHPGSLTAEERAEVVAVLTSNRFCDVTIPEV